ncbi:hypothetical protein [Sphingomonas sp. YL-JM2C]
MAGTGLTVASNHAAPTPFLRRVRDRPTIQDTRHTSAFPAEARLASFEHYLNSQTVSVLVLAVDIDGIDRWLSAMELDGSFQLFTAHEVFPCADQQGAAAFARLMISRATLAS